MAGQNRSTRRLLAGVLGSLLLSGVYGCADVRIVRETANGGVLALPMNSDCWPMYYRSRAMKLMRAKCPDGYRIEREEFVFNGTPGPQGHRYYDSYFGYTNHDDEMAPYLRKEYWIAFQAAPANGQPAAADGPAKSGRANPSSAPDGKGGDELPPPRPLKAG